MYRTLAVTLCLLAAAPLAAQKVYRWVDERGVVHYTDRAPPGREAGRVEVRRLPGEPGTLARLRIERTDAGYIALARNPLAGPVEVRLEFSDRQNVASEPALPLTRVLPAAAESRLATLQLADPGRPGGFSLKLAAVPGDPSAQPQDVDYLLPVGGMSWRIDQGFGGAFSHDDDQNRHAVDFAVPEGTPVLAAREGVVMQVESDFHKAGMDREKFASRANHIRILHPDGTMAVYAHLAPDGVLVREGQRVRAGQHIGHSGNTGFSSGPHLHFVVQVNRGMKLESIPFRLAGPQGTIAIPGQ
ncbi:peptidoglycan DD-metalloendopeptidase family protein [Rehaibacterium terrae]|jgi:murein DD-endopeptidase MepM/ murein hydrolase activator NlpD|uniref:Murein DD-endopeptidase MepM/ murein hydrolase activator NlpD n=1 Tax=Rehaibacterium terrae TaxID=1341696 RepID=A0A7W7Y0P9_9GAMM|nr:M23 family metallopeptidase [Rehaibacterium terrae]MBB5015942.1 murein DD-endopeptidase MepM/ murein hydrolase activator NlpD [Rehaibacterium terrae]